MVAGHLGFFPRTLSLCAVLSASVMPAAAFVTPPAVPSTVNCRPSPVFGDVCGVYIDHSGQATASFTSGLSFGYGPNFETVSSVTRSDGVIDDGRGLSGSLARADASSFAAIGALKSEVFAGAATSGWTQQSPNAGATSNSTVYFQDRLTFSAAGLPAGTMGIMTGHIKVNGAVAASAADYPWAVASAVAAVTTAAGTQTVSADGAGPQRGAIDSDITFELAVKFNEPYFTSLTIQLRTGSTASALWRPQWSYAANGGASFFSSVEWEGIDSVVDMQGNAITGWSVASASGFDYTRSYDAQATPVPEPGSWVLMAAGLALCAAVRQCQTAGARTHWSGRAPEAGNPRG